jgi:hypothetical protein
MGSALADRRPYRGRAANRLPRENAGKTDGTNGTEEANRFGTSRIQFTPRPALTQEYDSNAPNSAE